MIVDFPQPERPAMRDHLARLDAEGQLVQHRTHRRVIAERDADELDRAAQLALVGLLRGPIPAARW